MFQEYLVSRIKNSQRCFFPSSFYSQKSKGEEHLLEQNDDMFDIKKHRLGDVF